MSKAIHIEREVFVRMISILRSFQKTLKVLKRNWQRGLPGILGLTGHNYKPIRGCDPRPLFFLYPRLLLLVFECLCGYFRQHIDFRAKYET